MNDSAPERMAERTVTVYDRERQCLAPDCGRWFPIDDERRRWCSKLCKMRAFRAGLAFHKERKPIGD